MMSSLSSSLTSSRGGRTLGARRTLFTAGLALAFLGVASTAAAAPPSTQSAQSEAGAAAAPAPAAPPATPPVVVPAPGQAAASAPSPVAVPITATCNLGDHPGLEADEARTAADVVCHELAKRQATNTQHEVRFGKLGGRTLVTVASRQGNTYDERRAFVAGLDEIDVAGPRLADALATGKTFDDTRGVDSVTAAETRATKVQRGAVAFDGGVFGMTGVGTEAGVSTGLDLGLAYRAGNIGIGGHGRAGGIGSAETKLGTASLDFGVRYHFSDGDFAPFVGAGLGIAYFSLNREVGLLEGSGLGAHAAVGAEMLRSHHMALSVSLRADAPMFELKNANAEAYVVPLSLNIGLVFK